MKIIFIIPNLEGGGSEKFIVNLINGLIKSKEYEISLLLLEKKGILLEKLPLNLRIHDLKVKKVRNSLLKIYKIIKMEKPNIVFSTTGHLNVFMGLLKLFIFNKQIKFIARESNSVSTYNANQKHTFILNLFYKLFYNNFNKVICQSQYMKNDLIQEYNINENSITVINNMISKQKVEVKKSSKSFDTTVKLIAIGSLKYAKGFDLLIDTMYKLDEKYKLIILGEGKDKSILEEKIKILNLSHRVQLLGFKKNPIEYIAESDFFILSSRFEGFPNVVLESLSVGVPVIAFDCPGATREIITNNVNGLVVECGNTDALKNKIEDATLVDFNSKTISKNTLVKYSNESIINQYKKVFIEIANV